MNQRTKATLFICSTVFQNRSLMSKSSLFCKDNLISTHAVSRADTFVHNTWERAYLYKHRKDIFLSFWEPQKGPCEIPSQPQTHAALEHVWTSATRKAYVTQIGCVCFRSDKLRQPQGHCVSVHLILSGCFIEALGKREEQARRQCRMFLPCWQSFIWKWEIGLWKAPPCVMETPSVLGKIFLSMKTVFHESNWVA